MRSPKECAQIQRSWPRTEPWGAPALRRQREKRN